MRVHMMQLIFKLKLTKWEALCITFPFLLWISISRDSSVWDQSLTQSRKNQDNSLYIPKNKIYFQIKTKGKVFPHSFSDYIGYGSAWAKSVTSHY